MQTIVCGHANIFKPCKQLRVDTHTFSNCANNCLWTCKQLCQIMQTIISSHANNFHVMQRIVCGHAHISNRANKCVWTRKHFQTVQTIVCEQRKDLLLVDAPTWFPVDILKEQLAGFQRMQTIVLSPSCLLLSWCAWCFHRAA